jgi:glycosyltransferase involved in cell wall biosynthesis
MSEERVLIMSHGHPDFSLGGGEVAAYLQWKELRRRGIEAMLVARVADSPGHAGAPFFSRSADGMEVLFSPPPVNHFKHSQPCRRVAYEDFRSLLERFQPTVVHFHHYVHLGLELIREVRKYSPATFIALTFHEFLAICNANGQMRKTDGALCQKAAPLDCHLCFRSYSPQEFFLRELFVKSFLALVDVFVCPSQFLCDRYVAWGLPPEKMTVLENGQPQPQGGQGAVREEPSDRKLETRFLVLGQLSRRKGTHIVLEAVRLLPKEMRRLVHVEIHGFVPDEGDGFMAELERGLKELDGTVRLYGTYRLEDLGGIIRRNGWLIVPSLWWENSPVVIQEALAYGRPILCSNIGGMAEKVTPGVSGFHFRVNNTADLAALIEKCASTPEAWKSMCAGLPQPPTIDQTVDRLLELFRRKQEPVAAPVGDA